MTLLSTRLPHVISSETGMKVQHLLKQVDDDDINILICWSVIPPSEDTPELFQNVHEDVLGLVTEILSRKTTDAMLVAQARHALGIQNGECKTPPWRQFNK